MGWGILFNANKKKVQLKSKDNALLRPTLFCPAYQGISNKISTEQLMVVGTTVEETKAAWLKYSI